MNDKAIENRPSLSDEEIIGILYKYLRPEQVKQLVYSRTKDGIDCDYLTVECRQLVNVVISRTWTPLPESDTRGEVTELPPLDVTNREYYEWRSQCRRELACRELQLKSALASNLLLREENERLRAELNIALNCSEVNIDIANENFARAEAAEQSLATLRASASSDGWIDVKQELPPYGVLVWVVWHGVVQKIAYSRDIVEWVPWDGNSYAAPDGTFSHWMPLPTPPTATNTEKATSDRSQG